MIRLADNKRVLVAVRFLKRLDAAMFQALEGVRSSENLTRYELAFCGDAIELSAPELLCAINLTDHLLLHKAPQGLGRTNRLALREAAILNADALIILDGDGTYCDARDAIEATVVGLQESNVVVAQRSRVSLPIADLPGQDRRVFEEFERWLLEKRFLCSLPRDLQPGLYGFDRRAILEIELSSRHFAADWEIAFRALKAGLHIGASTRIVTTRDQSETTFQSEHQLEKLGEIFGLLEVPRDDVDRLLQEFAEAHPRLRGSGEFAQVEALCHRALECT